MQIDRLVISKEKLERLEIHGFSDASEVSYGACIYLRSIDLQGKLTTRLLCSKSRVAPLKKNVSAKIRTLCGHVVGRHVSGFSKSLEYKF